MGIDPGLAQMGWGVIEVSEDGKPALIEYGCLHTSKSNTVSGRLDHLYKNTCQLIVKYRPQEVAIEGLFFSSNTKTAMEVAQARGAVMIALNHSGIEVAEYTPLQIKQAVVGYGRAKKEQVQFMVRQFLGLLESPSPDHAADALAAALCHSGSRKLNRMIK
jgi:crossover junction endodeoxyribonuclease RuvC